MGHVKWYGNEGAVQLCGAGGLQTQVRQQPEQGWAGGAGYCGAAPTNAPGLPAPSAPCWAVAPLRLQPAWCTPLLTAAAAGWEVLVRPVLVLVPVVLGLLCWVGPLRAVMC